MVDENNTQRLATMYSIALDLVMGLGSMLHSPSSEVDQVASALKRQATITGNKLTRRQLEAAVAIMQTQTLKEAAERLCLSVHTMRRHVDVILEHTGLPLRGAAELRGWCIGVMNSWVGPGVWPPTTTENRLNRP